MSWLREKVEEKTWLLSQFFHVWKHLSEIIVSCFPVSETRIEKSVSCFFVSETGTQKVCFLFPCFRNTWQNFCFLFPCFGNNWWKVVFLVSCFETETEKLEPIVSKQMFLADLWASARLFAKRFVTRLFVGRNITSEKLA